MLLKFAGLFYSAIPQLANQRSSNFLTIKTLDVDTACKPEVHARIPKILKILISMKQKITLNLYELAVHSLETYRLWAAGPSSLDIDFETLMNHPAGNR